MSKRRKARRTTIDIIRELKAGTIAPSDVSPESRRACVQRLRMDGLTYAEISDLFGVSMKTISRDMKTIQRAAALRFTPDLTAELLGEFRTQVYAAVSRLRRLERDPAATPGDRIAANRAVIEIFDMFLQRLAQCGYVAPTQESRPRHVDIAEILQVSAVVLAEFGAESPLGRQLSGLIAPYTDSERDAEGDAA